MRKGNFLRGKDHPNWKGGVTSVNHTIRHSLSFKKWKTAIFTRDDWTCVECKKRGTVIHPAHIKPLAQIIQENNIKTIREAYKVDEFWDINNGRTLCVVCHGLEHGINFSITGNRTYRKYNCKNCLEDFKRSTKVGKKNPPKFCSRKCIHEYRKNNPEEYSSTYFKKGVLYPSRRNTKGKRNT